MGLFGKKKQVPPREQSSADIIRQELEALEQGGKPGPAPEPAKTTQPISRPQVARANEGTERSASNALFATLSHELRTPLNGVLGMAQLLREELPDNPKLDSLESSARHMLSVLHTLSNLAKIQDQWGELPEYREWVNLHDQLEQIKKNLGTRAVNRRLKIEIEHPNRTLRLRVDHDHLNNIVETALLGSLECTDINAEGAPGVLRISWEENAGEIRIIIENPLEALPRNRGQRIAEVSDLTTGSNHNRVRMEFLYWAVATSLLENYGGGMAATPMEGGQGVKTTIVFKMETMKASPSAERPIGGLSLDVVGKRADPILELPFCMRVLVVEDDPINRELMELLLQRIGQKAQLVKNGQAALDALAGECAVDLILMDIDMPVLDGISTTRAIRMGECGEAAMKLPIVAVTAFNTLSDQSKFKRVGMDYFLPKPIALKDLRSVLLDMNRKSG